MTVPLSMAYSNIYIYRYIVSKITCQWLERIHRMPHPASSSFSQAQVHLPDSTFPKPARQCVLFPQLKEKFGKFGKNMDSLEKIIIKYASIIDLTQSPMSHILFEPFAGILLNKMFKQKYIYNLFIYIYYVFIIYYIYLYYIHINDKPTGENHLKMSPGWTSRWQRKHQKASRETKGWNWKCDSWTGSATAWNMYHDLKTWKKIFQANGNDMRKCEKHFEDFKALWKTTRKDLGKCSIKMK